MSREKKKPIAFGGPIKLSVAKAAKEYLSTGRVLKKSSPRVELMAYEYAKSSLGLGEPLSKRKFIQAMSEKHNLTTSQVSKAITSKAFESAIAEYLPIDEITERHRELMDQNENLAVAADMVKLGYKVHNVGGEQKETKFAAFLQQINNNNYGGNESRTTEGPVVETVEPIQD
jgi:hypothetical protein